MNWNVSGCWWGWVLILMCFSQVPCLLCMMIIMSSNDPHSPLDVIHSAPYLQWRLWHRYFWSLRVFCLEMTAEVWYVKGQYPKTNHKWIKVLSCDDNTPVMGGAPFTVKRERQVAEAHLPGGVGFPCPCECAGSHCPIRGGWRKMVGMRDAPRTSRLGWAVPRGQCHSQQTAAKKGRGGGGNGWVDRLSIPQDSL